MQPSLLVLAAGMGNRYGGLKQLDAIGPDQQTLLQYSIFDAIKAGFKKIVFVIRKDFQEAFTSQITDKIPDHVQIEFAFQEMDDIPKVNFNIPEREKPWGTEHAVLVAKEKINESFGIINADDFYGRESFEKLFAFLSKTENKSTDFCMVGFELSRTLSPNGTVSRGICKIDENDTLLQVNEFTKIGKFGNRITDYNTKKEFTGDEIVSMNMWGCFAVAKPIHEGLINRSYHRKYYLVSPKIGRPRS